MLLKAYMYGCPGSLIYMQSSSFHIYLILAAPNKTSMHCNQLHCNVTIACFCLLVCCLHCMDPALIFL